MSTTIIPPTAPAVKAPSICCDCGGTDAAFQLARGLVCRACHTKDFWAEKIRWRQNGSKTGSGAARCFVIDGNHYTVERDMPRDYEGFVGMGGRPFRIEPFGGEAFTTRNLWSQGEIPAEFREALPDNARFLDGAAKVKVGGVTCWNPSEVKP